MMISYKQFLSVISKKRAWDCLFLVSYATLLFSSWNWLNSIVDWYGENHQTSSGWPAVYASVLLGAVVGVQWLAAAALFVAVPAIVVIWAAMVVLVTMVMVVGQPSWRVEVELRKVKRKIAEFVFKSLLKVASFVALLCALLAYFVVFNSYTSSS